MMSRRAWLSTVLQHAWWLPRPNLLARSLWPLSWLMTGLVRLHQWSWRGAWRTPHRLPVPVLVIGNLIIGGAGKTPTTLAVVQCLQAAGWRPGVISRGYGRQNDEVLCVTPSTDPVACGDEPLLIRRRSGVPVAVGRHRAAAGLRLLDEHPEVNILVCDDGLQHHALARELQVIVFDRRGVGNGWVLPAGPLRQPMPATPPPRSLVLYNADRASTPWPGALARRRLGGAVELSAWRSGALARPEALDALAKQSQVHPLLAAAGLAEPARFFDMLTAAGVRVKPLPLPDHASFDVLPWPDDTPDVLVTEKDAVKLQPVPGGLTRIWVVTLDFLLPSDFSAALLAALGAPGQTATPTS